MDLKFKDKENDLKSECEVKDKDEDLKFKDKNWKSGTSDTSITSELLMTQ